MDTLAKKKKKKKEPAGLFALAQMMLKPEQLFHFLPWIKVNFS